MLTAAQRLLLLVLLMPAVASAADELPPVGELPARAELPDPLLMLDGSRVRTPDDWFDNRRPELKRLFQHYMYGYMPAAPERVSAIIEHEDDAALGGKALVQELTLRFQPEPTPPIRLLLILPKGSDTRAPLFVAANFCGNHAVLEDPKIAIPTQWMYKHCPGCVNNRATEAGRGAQKDVWCVETLIARGYGLATFYNGDLDPDSPEFTDGVHPHFYKPGQTAPAPHDWGAIAAWAWGVSRAVDYLVSRADVDPARIAVTGHSRLGKTALLAGAFDERIAIVVPHQSGTGGCALSRENDQETVERINRAFPHWFNDVFPQFAGREDRLPIDQHLLMALVAPRPLLDTEGDQDKWANYNSGFKGLQAADKVYKFLGAKGIAGTGLIQGDEPMSGPNFGDVVQYRRDLAHVLNVEYWKKILDFADAHYTARKPMRVK